MYFTGRLHIDPLIPTVIERHELKGPFMKLLNFLTREDITPEEEHETFTAVAMMKHLREAFQEAGVTNLIRLCKNKVAFYVDEKGDENDLDRAVTGFLEALRPHENEKFETLDLALEHREGGLHFLIEVHVDRSHAVGAFPVWMKINAFQEQQFPAEITMEWVEEHLRSYCQTQDQFDAFLEESKAAFSGFLTRLENTLRNSMEIRRVEKKEGVRLVRPKEVVVNLLDLKKQLEKSHTAYFPKGFDPDPIFSGYPRFQFYLLECFQWGRFCHKNGLHCKDMEVVDELGRRVMQIGETGLFAGATKTLNPGDAFEAAKGGDIIYFDENSFFNEMDRLGLVK